MRTPTSSTMPAAQRALLVDDDLFMAEIVGDMLRDLGLARVSTATGGDDAIKAYDDAKPQPDLVVCDLHMPGGNGFEFMERLSERGFAGGIVLMSGLDSRTMNSAALMARFHNLNILGTLAKPFNKPALGALLGPVLASR